MQFSVQFRVLVFFLWLLSFAQRDEEKKDKKKTRTKDNQPRDTCSLVKKWEPSLKEQVKTLEVQQLKMRIWKWVMHP